MNHPQPTAAARNPSAFIRAMRDGLRMIGLETPGRGLYHRLTRRGSPASSETAKCRARLARFCAGYGIDVGFGGDPIVPHAIGMDMPQPYTNVGKSPVQLGGDASRLTWFADETLDFVYSSHVLEDFADVGGVLAEWLRILKIGGCLVLYCPDEKAYRRYCAATGHGYNHHHVHADFSLVFVKRALARLTTPVLVLHENPLVDAYSWELVVEKLAART